MTARLPIGVVEDVQFAMTADGGRRLDDAAPLLAVTSPEGDEILIPFAKAFLVAVDTEAKRIEMKLPEGLVEVNRSASGDATRRRSEVIGHAHREDGIDGTRFRSSLSL